MSNYYKSLWETIDDLAEMIDDEESRPAVINNDMVERLMDTYDIIKKITYGTGVNVSYKINEPFKSMGSVSVTGKSVDIMNISGFIGAIRMASNFEAYPKSSGDICMTLTFHGLTTPLR